VRPPDETSPLDSDEEGVEHAGIGDGSMLQPEEGYECAEILEFVAGLLKAEPRLMRAAMAAYAPGYGVAELRRALLHFARRLMETTS
jgi:hypothetical protein